MIRLTDEQWERIRDHFPEEHIADGRPGRKPIASRRVLEAVLWILNTGAQWHMLPQSYPNYKTVHRRFQAWCRDEAQRTAGSYMWVNRVTLAVCRSLPVYTQLRTSRCIALHDAMCHVQTIIAFHLAGFQAIQKSLSLRPFRESSGNPM
jgi:transposase